MLLCISKSSPYIVHEKKSFTTLSSLLISMQKEPEQKFYGNSFDV